MKQKVESMLKNKVVEKCKQVIHKKDKGDIGLMFCNGNIVFYCRRCKTIWNMYNPVGLTELNMHSELGVGK